MSIVSSPRKGGADLSSTPTEDVRRAGVWVGFSSLLFAFLQSVCTLLMAMAGLRLIIGVGSLALSTGATTMLDRLHANWIRVPMISLALIGALVNLIAILQIRSLRSRPASQWRQTPPTPQKLRMERLQIFLSVVTLVLVAVEEYFHHRLFHGL